VGAAGLAEVLATFGAAYLESQPLPRGAAKVWRAIATCRSAALGGHLEACAGCGTLRQRYHSCRNRHCPRCQSRAKEAWLSARRREVLPLPYFHLVFTLPHALNGLIGAAPRALYETLFAAAAATLTEFGASPRHLGGTLAFTLVLHTWTQDLRRHVHVHALVAGGALAPNGAWIAPKKGFLFPVRALSKVFRGKFVAALGDLRTSPRLATAFEAEGDWQRLKRVLYAHDWVVYAKQPLGGAQAVLDYLGRYTHRVAVSNERILGIDGTEVLLRVRADATNGKKRTVRIAGTEFIRRFLLHVLPPGFKRIRHYGLLAPGRKKQALAAARAALGAPTPQPALIESVAAFVTRIGRIASMRCPHCGGAFRVIDTLAPLPPAQRSRAPP
jgi:Putative transposase/Transposase zinc-binding domain